MYYYYYSINFKNELIFYQTFYDNCNYFLLQLVTVLEEYLEDYNQISTNRMKLVLFMDAIKHITRIGRIIRQPYGNALLLGMGGSGRQSLTRLASHVLVIVSVMTTCSDFLNIY